MKNAVQAEIVLEKKCPDLGHELCPGLPLDTDIFNALCLETCSNKLVTSVLARSRGKTTWNHFLKMHLG